MPDIRPDCPVKDCEGHIEARTGVYLEVGGTFDGDEFVIERLEFSALNDEIDGHPLDLEAGFTVSCSEGHHFTERLSPEVRARVGLQPIGNAPRTLGKRGGL